MRRSNYQRQKAPTQKNRIFKLFPLKKLPLKEGEIFSTKNAILWT
jgi:hypothetical protein